MRLRLIAFVLATLGVATTAQAQTYFWVEPQVALEQGEANVETGESFANLSFGHQWSPKWGIWLQTAHGNLWGETAVGPSFQLSDQLNVGVGIGIEHFEPKSLRLRLNAYYDAPSGSLLYIQYDRGKDSSWVWADATLLRRWLGLGVILQMPDAGVGPKVEFRMGKHLGIWVAPVYDWESDVIRTLVGGRIMLDK